MLSSKEMALPDKEMRLKIAQEFHKVTDFSELITCRWWPEHESTLSSYFWAQYFSYKCCSTVLLGVADTYYCFTATDTRCIWTWRRFECFFRSSKFGKQKLDLPSYRPLPLTIELCLPFALVGDEAFRLNDHIHRGTWATNTKFSTADYKKQETACCMRIRITKQYMADSALQYIGTAWYS